MNVIFITLLALLAVPVLLALFTWAAARSVQAALPPQGRFIDVPGARLHVVEKGSGPAVLLIHGLAGQLCHFTYGVVDRLARDHRVVAVDRPGSGYSVRSPGAAATLSAQADAIAALIEKLQLGQPLVVGHSLGGAVALCLAQRHPDRVAGLALVAPLTHTPQAVPAAFDGLMITRPWVRALVGWTLALPVLLLRSKAVLGLVFGPETVPRDFATRGGGLLGVRPSHFVGAATDLDAVPHDLPALEAGYRSMRLPVQVLYGRGDRVLSPAVQGQGLTAALPGAQLTLVDGGHMLPVTQPELTAGFIAAAALQLQAAQGSLDGA
jgi:pimeloyl-ACP methyl ester carboxylesterase